MVIAAVVVCKCLQGVTVCLRAKIFPRPAQAAHSAACMGTGSPQSHFPPFWLSANHVFWPKNLRDEARNSKSFPPQPHLGSPPLLLSGVLFYRRVNPLTDANKRPNPISEATTTTVTRLSDNSRVCTHLMQKREGRSSSQINAMQTRQSQKQSFKGVCVVALCMKLPQ